MLQLCNELGHLMSSRQPDVRWSLFIYSLHGSGLLAVYQAQLDTEILKGLILPQEREVENWGAWLAHQWSMQFLISGL